MEISNNILVGVNIKRYVEYYQSVRTYADQLCEKNIELTEHNLVGLVVHNDNNFVYEHYYTKYNDVVYLTISIGSIKDKTAKWIDTIETTDTDMFEHIRKQEHILDLEYYIKNN